jgi:isoleucyl-tRNA synthetase
MQLAQDASSLLLSLRKKANIKVRQPLQKAMIPLINPNLKSQIESIEDIIKSEVNIKEIEFIDGDNEVIKKKIKPNFKTLGAKLGDKMKWVANDIKTFGAKEIQTIEQYGKIDRSINGETLEILLADTEITSDDIPGLLVANKGILTIALNIELTEELIAEGLAREFVNKIQKIRKDAQFELTDRIHVEVEEQELLKSALTRYNSYICTEILADDLVFLNKLNESIEIELNEHILKVNISKK